MIQKMYQKSMFITTNRLGEKSFGWFMGTLFCITKSDVKRESFYYNLLQSI